MTNAQKTITTIHGVLMRIFDQGVLIIGESGIGKSETALDLILRHHRLIADDQVQIYKSNDQILIGQANDFLPYHMSIRGLGIINIQDLYGVEHVCQQQSIDLIVKLTKEDQTHKYDLLGIDDQLDSILDVNIKALVIPATRHKNLANIIEVAVKNERLKSKGIHSALVFHQKLNQKLSTPQN